MALGKRHYCKSLQRRFHSFVAQFLVQNRLSVYRLVIANSYEIVIKF